MDSVTVITNNVPRDIIEGFELTEDEQSEFDYIDWEAIAVGEDTAYFFRYKGELHDLGDMEYSQHPPNWMSGWNNYKSDTFFSGILVRYVDDFERVVVGRYYS